MDNKGRREILNKAKAAGFSGSYIDLFRAVEAGVPLENILMNTQQQEQGLIPSHQNGDTTQSVAIPNVPAGQPITTVGLKAPIDVHKVSPSGNLVESYKSVPPGISSLPTGPNQGMLIETPAATYLNGGYEMKVPYNKLNYKK